MVSAISFGVFCRLAPSTSAIMRSRKVSPGFGGDADDEPVGEHPRAAGDRAAVAAALADDRRALAGDGALVDRGDALDDLAVARDARRPASTRTTSPLRSVGRGDGLGRGRVARVATAACASDVCARACRSASACALPRPSAIASAKLANSTVNQSQTDDREDEAGRRLAVADQRLRRQSTGGQDAARPRPRT